MLRRSNSDQTYRHFQPFDSWLQNLMKPRITASFSPRNTSEVVCHCHNGCEGQGWSSQEVGPGRGLRWPLQPACSDFFFGECRVFPSSIMEMSGLYKRFLTA